MVRDSKWDNGDCLKDRITGFEGIVMVVAFYSTGCIHYGLLDKNLNKDGSMNDWLWLDECRLDLVNEGAVSFTIDANRVGGPMPCGPE